MNPESSFYELIYPGGKLSLDTPRIMGILNTTPDSFYSDSRTSADSDVLERARQMIADGADILDFGGQSTRPGAERKDAQTEMSRVIPAIELVRAHFPDICISIDTFYSEVAGAAVRAGANIINDISGGSLDANMFSTAAQLKVPYVLTHIQGEPQTMQNAPQYDDVVAEVLNHLNEKISVLNSTGVEQIIIDPGFGFGKTMQHNLRLLRELHLLGALNRPLLAGLSRKKTLQQLVNRDSSQTLNATTVANTIALMQGVSILRVHDVGEAVEARTIVQAMNKA
ncbi:MAG: dihydropteroate synthase [Flavobacteriales bacterium]